MKENLYISLNAVFPMFLMMLLGAFARKTGIIKKEEISRLNSILFKLFFPFLMFDNIYAKHIESSFDPKLVSYALFCTFSVFCLSWVIVCRIEKRPKSRGAMIQAIYRSNFIIIGLPIVANIYKDADLSVTALLIAIVVPIYNILAVFTLEYHRGGKVNKRKILVSTLTNPIIIGTIAAFLLMGLKISLPETVLSATSSLARVTTPAALVILGANFSIKSLNETGRNVVICVAARLVIVPGLALAGGMLLGFRDIALATLLAIFASPSALSSFTMADAMGSDADLAENAVIFSSILSCFTMFFWILFMKTHGFL